MPRPIWSGMISFGLVNVPVRLYNATKKKTVRFNQLRKGDGCRIRLKKICSSDEKDVQQGDIARGYEVSPQRYVVVTDEDMEALAPKASRLIEIGTFVKLEQIDPIYYEQTYYLMPDKGAAKAYSLLLTAMNDTGKVGVARFVLRNKEYLAALRPYQNILSLSVMLFSDEIVSVGEFEEVPEQIELNPKEVNMAKQLVDTLTMEFEPEQYKNEYYYKILDMIEKKAEGEVIESQPASTNDGKVLDLMAALEASMKAIKDSNSKTKKKSKLKKEA
jgi:DNA end-binding protein Ku